MFIDEIGITIESGTGGDGLCSFRREKFVEYGGPYGGSGGRGGAVIVRATLSERTLLKYRYQKIYQALGGANGQSKAMHGKNAPDLVLEVPVGTMILTKNGELLADLKQSGDEKTLLTGGNGGRGNFELARSGQGHLEISEKGEPAKQLDIILNLKLLSDVGIIGIPSAGKSTFLSRITNAKPKIGDYPFTTLVPNLGIASTNDKRSFVIADMPGLIAGASVGRGLGDQFLKHIQRTKVLVHIVDMGSEIDVVANYAIIRDEMGKFDKSLLSRPEIIIANKKDLPDFQPNLKKFKQAYPDKPVIELSIKSDSNLSPIISQIADVVDKLEQDQISFIEKSKRNYTFQVEQPYTIAIQEDGTYVVTGKKIQRLVDITDFSTKDNLRRFLQQVKGMGIEDSLRELGIQQGNTVDLAGYIFEYTE